MNIDYLISEKKEEGFQHSISIDNFYINHSSDEFMSLQTDYLTIAVFGDFLDVRNIDISKKQIVKEMLAIRTLADFIQEMKFLSGRYLFILSFKNEKKFVFTDPSSSIPAYYTSYKGDTFLISSNQQIIAERLNLEYSKKALAIKNDSRDIKNSAFGQQTMPYDITMYDEIKFLLPNFYLNITSRKVKRYFPITTLEENSLDYVVEKTVEYGKNAIDYFYNTYGPIIPMTSGLDSRFILSFLKDKTNTLQTYTFFHKETFDEKTDDYYIPVELSEKFNYEHHVVEREHLNKNHIEEVTDQLANMENVRILENAYTFKTMQNQTDSFFGGDILPLAKSNFGKNLSESFATTSFFANRSLNYSDENFEEVDRWLKDSKVYTSQFNVSLFDLYFWESRIARWFSNNVRNYDYYTNPLIPFNNRYLIELWLSVPRANRVKKQIHYNVIEQNWPELLEVPLNPGENTWKDKIKNQQYLYYFGTFINHYIEKY